MNNNHINLNFKYDLLYVKKQFLKCVTKNLQESDCSFFFFPSLRKKIVAYLENFLEQGNK